MGTIIAVQAQLDKDFARKAGSGNIPTITPQVDTTNSDLEIVCSAGASATWWVDQWWRVAIPQGACSIHAVIYSGYASTVNTSTGFRAAIIDKSANITRYDAYMRYDARKVRTYRPSGLVVVTPYDEIAATGEPAYLVGWFQLRGDASATVRVNPPIIYFETGGGHRL